MDMSKLYVGRAVVWETAGRITVYYGVVTGVIGAPIPETVTIRWDDMPNTPTTYNEERMDPYLRILCCNCGQREELHDPTTGKCLFGAGVWL